MTGKRAILRRGIIAHLDRTYFPGDFLPEEISQRTVEKQRAVWPDDPEYAEMSYRELQELAKSRGLPANGKKDELVARLGESYGE